MVGAPSRCHTFEFNGKVTPAASPLLGRLQVPSRPPARPHLTSTQGFRRFPAQILRCASAIQCCVPVAKLPLGAIRGCTRHPRITLPERDMHVAVVKTCTSELNKGKRFARGTEVRDADHCHRCSPTGWASPSPVRGEPWRTLSSEYSTRLAPALRSRQSCRSPRPPQAAARPRQRPRPHRPKASTTRNLFDHTRPSTTEVALDPITSGRRGASPYRKKRPRKRASR